MGLDYPTLENYGGFDALLERTLQAGSKDDLGSAAEYFSMILKQALLDGTPVSKTWLKTNSGLCTEIEEGITALGDRTEEVKEKLRALFPTETAKE